MRYKIWNEQQICALQKQMEALTDTTNYCKTDSIVKVIEIVETYVSRLNSYYGSKRNPDTQLGGWVAVFIADTLAVIQKEYKQFLREYSLNPNLAEIREIITGCENNVYWVIELYIVSSDYSYVLIFPQKGDV